MKHNLFCALVIFLLPFAVWAGGRDIGNGGDAIVCRDAKTKKINKVEVLDYFEARNVLKTPVDLGPEIPGSDGVEMAMRAVDRLSLHHPVTAMFYRERLKNFFDDARIEFNMRLHPIDDTNVLVLEERKSKQAVNEKLENNYLMIPKGCQMIQLAIRRDKQMVADHKTFTINGDLWKLLSPTDRAGLLLHEVMYEDMLLTDQYGRSSLQHLVPDSRDVRYVNSVFANPESAKLGDREYLRLVAARGWFIEDFLFPELISSATHGTGEPDQYFTMGQFPKDRDVPLTIGGRSFMALRASIYEVYVPGVFKKIVIAAKTRVDLPSGSFFAAAGSEINFASDGIILRAVLDGSAEFKVSPAVKIKVRGNAAHAGVPAFESTNFAWSQTPVSFQVRETQIDRIGLTMSAQGRLVADFTLPLYVQCAEDAVDFCVNLYPSGVVRSVKLRAQPSTFDLELLDTQNQLITFTKLYEKALLDYQYGAGPAPRLPETLNFDEQGRVRCPYTDTNGQCHWIQKL